MTSDFAEQLRRLRADRDLSVRGLAALAHCGKSHVHDLETGRRQPTPAIARSLDDALGAHGRLVGTLRAPMTDDDESELDAIELVRRVSASDVGNETLEQLERAADTMAMAYATTPPDQLLPQVRRHLSY